MELLSSRILAFNEGLQLDGDLLPEDVDVMNPFKGEYAGKIGEMTREFYQKYYNDNNKRFLVLGINPGRMGAGLTGIPFTDTDRLEQDCGISARGIQTRETSAVFVYEVIEAFGGPEAFYNHFFIGAASPLGFIKRNAKGRWVNYNYYDDKEMLEIMTPYIKNWLLEQFELGMFSEVAFCLGTGKNFTFLQKINKELNVFEQIIPLEHPRFIMQYRNKRKQEFIDKFIRILDKHAFKG